MSRHSVTPKAAGSHAGPRHDRRSFALGLGAAWLASACGGNSSATTGAARVVRVGMLRISPHLMAPKFYQRFLPPELTVETVLFNNSTELKTAIITGSIDFGVTGITAALQGASRDEPFRVLAAAADGASAIVARNDKGIETVADLRGRTVGYVPGSAQDVLLRLSLRDQGLDASRDVRLLKVGFGDMANALERGDIDAFTGAETGPSVALLRGRSHVVSYPYGTKMGKINIVFGTRQRTIDEKPDLCALMVKTHAAATDYMRAHPAEWAASTSKTWGAAIEAVELAIRNISLRWRIDDAYVDQSRVLGEQLESLKQVKKQPDYLAFFDMRFARSLSEEALGQPVSKAVP